jgi:hypothetical protein
VTPGLLGALLAALAYGAATVLQAVAVRRVARLPTGTPLLRRARTGWPYAVGLALDGLGFLASVAALRTLPLFLVESAVAASVAVTAVLSVLLLHVRLGAAEVVALAVVGVGLAGLAFAAAETVVPAVVGVLVLGDRVVPGRGLLAAAAFVATLGGCVALAGRAEPDVEPQRT